MWGVLNSIYNFCWPCKQTKMFNGLELLISQTFQDLSPNGEKVSGMSMICPHGS